MSSTISFTVMVYLGVIIIDNDKTFDSENIRTLYNELHFKLLFTSPTQPIVNGKVEATNEAMKKTLKSHLGAKQWA